jgi:hypothetical protein
MFTFAIDRGAFATFGWEDANEAGRSKSVDLERIPELRMCAALTSYPHERWGVVRAPFFCAAPRVLPTVAPAAAPPPGFAPTMAAPTAPLTAPLATPVLVGTECIQLADINQLLTEL